MRYHWGLGVGHLHAHQFSGASGRIHKEPGAQNGQSLDEVVIKECDVNPQAQPEDGNSDACDSDPELDLGDREYEGWDDVESDDDGIVDLECTNSEEEE